VVNPNPAVSGRFGVAAAFAGDRLVVGANGNGAGEVFVFDSTGAFERSFSTPTQQLEAQFGFSLSEIDSNRVIVGAYRFGTGGAFQRGAAFVHDVNSGGLLRTIENPTPQTEDFFGFNVAAVSGDRVLIGSHNDDTAASNAGALYLFDASTGGLLKTYLNPQAQVNSYFGLYFVPVGDDKVLVSAIEADVPSGTDAGAAYLIDLASGTTLKTFVNPNPNSADFFGNRMAVIGDQWLAISAPRDDTDAPDTGIVYIYDQTTYELVATIHNPEPGNNDGFGFGMSGFRENELLIGAFDNNVVYRYVVPEPGSATLGAIVFCLMVVRRSREV
jgi:hypothetical protein